MLLTMVGAMGQYSDFLQRQEQKHRPRPDLWFAATLLWLIFGLFLIGESLVKPGEDSMRSLGLVLLAAAVATAWRWRRDVHRMEIIAADSKDSKQP